MSATYRGGVARIDVFFSGLRNGDGDFVGDLAKKNFGINRMRNSDAQHGGRAGFKAGETARRPK